MRLYILKNGLVINPNTDCVVTNDAVMANIPINWSYQDVAGHYEIPTVIDVYSHRPSPGLLNSLRWMCIYISEKVDRKEKFNTEVVIPLPALYNTFRTRWSNNAILEVYFPEDFGGLPQPEHDAFLELL